MIDLPIWADYAAGIIGIIMFIIFGASAIRDYIYNEHGRG